MHLAGMLAHDAGAGGEFLCGFPAHGQAHQEGADLFGCSLSGQELVEGALKRAGIQRLAPRYGLQGRGETVWLHTWVIRVWFAPA